MSWLEIEEEQLSLFVENELPRAVQRSDLRWYQEEAYAAAMERLKAGGRTLLVMATGLGKTQTFATIARDWPGSVLILAHREELVEQAARTLERLTGEPVEIEQGTLRSSRQARLVVGSVQSFNKKRLERLGADRFSLIITDEAHHYIAKTYRRAIEFFNCPRLGPTATPDRGDEQAMGQIFDDCCYQFDIEDGIDQGYLVPLRGITVTLSEIDLSGVAKTAGDLVAAQLDEVMLKACAGLVSEMMRLEPNRRGIVFMPGVKSAELGCSLANRAKPGCACFVSGETDPNERRQLVADFKAGVYQYLFNCMIATEGFDAPSADLVVMGRPTLSRALCAQQVGRGTRVLPGIVDHIPGKEGAAARRALIAASAKPDCVVMDFVGNSGRHSLASVTDVLGGRYTDEEREKAKKVAKDNPGKNARDSLEQARGELRQIAEAAKVKVKSVTREFNPFQVLHLDMPDTPVGKRTPMTAGQYDFLVRLGVPEADIAEMDKAAAKKVMDSAIMRRKKGLATYKQLRILQKYGVTEINLSFQRASSILDYIFGRKKDRMPIDPGHLDFLVHRQRDAGDEARA